MTTKTTTAHRGRSLAIIAVVMFLVLGLCLLWGMGTLLLRRIMPAATVTLDVNPSFEIRISKNETVLALIPQNDAARSVLGEADMTGRKLDAVLPVLVRGMQREAYFTDADNSILVSVETNDGYWSQSLMMKISDRIYDLLDADDFRAAVRSQAIQSDEALEATADQYGISVGRAAFIQKIVQQSHHTLEELADLSIHELLLLESNFPEGGFIAGSFSEEGYIGRSAAYAIATEHAEVDTADIRRSQIRFDWDDGRMVYEIEFTAGEYEYEYDIHAKDGTILTREKERERVRSSTDTTNPPSQEPPGTETSPILDRDAALNTALAHAGVRREEIRDLDMELDEEWGTRYYEISFDTGGYEYEYEIALDGTILHNKKERDD